MLENFAEQLSLVLEDTSTLAVDSDPFNHALEISNQLEEARRQVADLERQLIHATDRLCGGLAVGVRKYQPGLNVGLDRGSCRVGYKTKSLLFRPDLGSRVWRVESADPAFGRRFQRTFAPNTALTSDLTELAMAVAKYFNDHYRSLHEDIEGEGVILVDGRTATYCDLVRHVKIADKVLREAAGDEAD